MLAKLRITPLFRDRTNRGYVVAIFLCALVVRLAYLLLSPQQPIVFDAMGFYQTGLALAQGTTGAAARYVLGIWGPGYPVFLSLIFFFISPDVWPVRYAQAGLGALSCVVVYLIGLQISNRRAAILAGLLMILSPTFIVFTGLVLTETVATFLFWLAILVLFVGLSNCKKYWIACSGLLIGLACLTRPTLLPTLPFLIIAILVAARDFTRSFRIVSAVFFALPVFALLLGWSVVSSMNGNLIASPNGLVVMLQWIWSAASPQALGWEVDIGVSPGSWLRQQLADNPTFVIAALPNLVFQNFWLVEDVWRGGINLSPQISSGLQRIVILLALGGIGIGVSRWRLMAPLFAALGASVLGATLFIEVRRSLPFMPALFLFSGLFLSSLVEWLKSWTVRVRLLVIMLYIVVMTLIILDDWLPSKLIALLQTIAPTVSGSIGDLTIMALSVICGATVFIISSRIYPRRQALAVGLVPSILFVILFGSYLIIGSEPRWRGWLFSFANSQTAITQEIRLPVALAANQVESAAWLVDLESESDPPPLRVFVNGTLLSKDQYRWQRLFCTLGNDSSNGNPDLLRRDDLVSAYLPTQTLSRDRIISNIDDRCQIYEVYNDFTFRTMGSWRQWWAISLEPALLDGKTLVSLTLARQSQSLVLTNPNDVLIGGAFQGETDGVFYGPSLQSLIVGPKTSVYKWLVTDDWRLWESSHLASVSTRSYVVREYSPKQSGTGEASIGSTFPEILSHESAQWIIRLLIRTKDGSQILY